MTHSRFLHFNQANDVNGVKIGTSGFSFMDWVGVFYPAGFKKEDMFAQYVEYFDTVEINSTYYRIPQEKVFAALEDKTSGSFEFIVKLNKESTHERKNAFEAIEALQKSVTPLIKKQKLKGFLAQFPFSFRNTGENRLFLKNVKEKCGDVPLFVEFRHSSWLKQAVYDFIESLNVHYCCVDEPDLPGLIPHQDVSTAGIGYVRFHGRNKTTWWDSSKGDRYDYLYTKDELTGWIERIREINRKSDKTYLFFNNCYMGNAIRSAKMMAEIIKNQYNIVTVLKDIPV